MSTIMLSPFIEFLLLWLFLAVVGLLLAVLGWHWITEDREGDGSTT